MADDQRDQSDQPQADQPAQPPAVGWGDPISDDRKAELKALAGQQAQWAAQPETERGDSRFKGVNLTGADVFWLAVLALAGAGGDTAAAGPNCERRSMTRPLAFFLHFPRCTWSGASLSERT